MFCHILNFPGWVYAHLNVDEIRLGIDGGEKWQMWFTLIEYALILPFGFPLQISKGIFYIPINESIL